VLVKVLAERLYDGLVDEELEVSFLVDIAIVGAPTVCLIIGFSTIYHWLRVQGEHFVLVHQCEYGCKIIGLGSELTL